MPHNDSVVIYPNIGTLAEGFPSIDGFGMYVIALGDNTSPTKTITLQFSRCNPDRTVLEEIHVYLLNGEYGLANFESYESLPHLAGYKIEQTQDRRTRQPMKLLVLDFDRGSLSFNFERVFHATSSYKTK
jgi:hypothetical protein